MADVSRMGRADLDGKLRFAVNSLKYYAIPLRELDERGQLVGARGGFEIEAQTDRAESHRRVLGDAQGAAEIQIALGAYRAALHVDVEGGGNRFQGDAGA